MIIYDDKTKHYFQNMFSKEGKQTNKFFFNSSKNIIKNDNKYNNVLYGVLENFNKKITMKNPHKLKIKTKFNKTKKMKIKKSFEPFRKTIYDNFNNITNDIIINNKKINNKNQGYTFNRCKKIIIKPSDNKDQFNHLNHKPKIKGWVNFYNKLKRTNFINKSYDLNYNINNNNVDKSKILKFNNLKRDNLLINKNCKFELSNNKYIKNKINNINFNKTANFKRLNHFEKPVYVNSFNYIKKQSNKKFVNLSINSRKIRNDKLPIFMNNNIYNRIGLKFITNSDFYKNKKCNKFKNKTKNKNKIKNDNSLISIDIN